MDSIDFRHAVRSTAKTMMHHCAAWYLLTDAIADLRAWLWSLYADEGQMIALVEADARAALRKAKQKTR